MMVIGATAGDIAKDEGKLANAAFLQWEAEEPQVVEARRTLIPDRLYLDTCFSFQMCFTNKHMRDMEAL